MKPSRRINLHIPEELLPRGILHRDHIGPLNHRAFSRVDPCDGTKAPVPSPAAGSPYELHLHTYLRRTRLYDVYRATIESQGPRVTRSTKLRGDVMVKIMASDTFDGTAWMEELGHDTALDAAYYEAVLFERHLSKARGKPSPEFHGLFALRPDDWDSEYQVLVMVLEDVTEPIHRHPLLPFAFIEADVR